MKELLLKILLQIVVFCVGSLIVAMIINTVRSDTLPLVMPFPPEYQCPSIVKTGAPVKVEMALDVFGRADIAFVDARSKEKFEKGHIKNAVHIPYSFIEPIPKQAVTDLRPYETVIVYCNTKGAERSRMMAGELARAGVEGVAFLEDGFLNWVKNNGEFIGAKPDAYEEIME